MQKSLFIGTLLSAFFFSGLHPALALTPQQAAEKLSLTELAETYSPAQISALTQQPEANRFDALMITIGALTADDLKNPAAESDKLQAFVDAQQQDHTRYLGNVSDKNIVPRLHTAWKTAVFPNDPKTLKTLNNFIDKGYTSGYNLVDTREESAFDKTRMIRYGHNDIDHAAQLIYLLRREGFDPKVQLTPKSSAFLYLDEWGEADYPVTTLKSGKKVAIASEYNLDLEFPSAEERNRFQNLIDQYAKKNTADQKGLIRAAWWQPFYRSYVPVNGYDVVAETRVTGGHYQADLMALPENAEKQAENIRKAKSGMQVTSEKVWVNPSFYRYLQGDYK
ncbi:TPA: hypothetical protein SLE25_000169 [Morganella morganii]|nr:hypothetical protein [Morganella morganii]